MANVNRYMTAKEIINRAAVEVGLAPVTDPFTSPDPLFRQMIYLLDSCGQTLMQDYPWQRFQVPYELTTQVGDSGNYDLPTDFAYMIDQTGWQQGGPAVWPLMGPASPQIWTFLKAAQIYSQNIYVWFRIKEGQFSLFPQPPPVGIPIAFEYISRGWAQGPDVGAGPVMMDHVTAGEDIVLYEPRVIINYLRLKFLTAKGFDTAAAQGDFAMSLESWKGKDNSAPILNAGRPFEGYRFLDNMNVPATGFGS